MMKVLDLLNYSKIFFNSNATQVKLIITTVYKIFKNKMNKFTVNFANATKNISTLE